MEPIDKKEAERIIRNAAAVEAYVVVTEHDGYLIPISKVAALVAIDKAPDGVEIKLVVRDDGVAILG